MNKVFLGILSGAFAFATSVAPATAEIALKMNTGEPAGGISDVGMRAFKQCVETRSNNEFKVSLFHSGALGDERAAMEAVLLGTLDIAVTGSAITNIEPLFNVFALPYMFRDRRHVDAVMDGPVRDLLTERLDKKGYVLLGLWELGFRQITNNVRPIVVPADLKGIKIRTPSSATRIRIFNAYGANASALPYSEVYSALQLGVYDGQENPAESAKSARFYEVQKFISYTNHVYSNFVPIMGKTKFEKLTRPQQLLLKQCGFEARRVTVEYGATQEAEMRQFLESKGMKINDADVQAFVGASRPIWDQFAAELGPDGALLVNLISAVK